MTQEDKQLLLKDLCGRLPYGVKCEVHYIFNNETTYGEDVEAVKDDVINKIDFVNEQVYTCKLGIFSFVEDVKPYLRPMSSMTEEEYEYYNACAGYGTYEEVMVDRLNFLHKKHFDYRGLIEKGLALKAKDGMYKTK